MVARAKFERTKITWHAFAANCERGRAGDLQAAETYDGLATRYEGFALAADDDARAELGLLPVKDELSAKAAEYRRRAEESRASADAWLRSMTMRLTGRKGLARLLVLADRLELRASTAPEGPMRDQRLADAAEYRKRHAFLTGAPKS